MGVADIAPIMTFISSLQSPAQFVVLGLLMFIFIGRVLSFNEYKIKRKHMTKNKTLSFAESVLKNIKTESMDNMKAYMIQFRNGVLTEMDRFELSAIKLAITDSLEVQTKNHLKTIIYANGYYRKIKNKDNIDDLIHTRSYELRSISANAVDETLRDDSPLQGQAETRFSYAQSEKLYVMVVNRHVDEIDSEVNDINNKAKELFLFLSVFFKYEHEEEEFPE